ncbi:MAG: 4-hydroxy-3-methylbut-2-enyl diphosphate reductase [Candidatus Zapsychrus exili]|nr:4-hydroxy-3-methylbut-2-enyl diphosphate reductase [Candidatus Zapsychrus exili]
MEIYLAKTQGFCAGVSFAINIVKEALKKYGSPLYVYHEIVHNTFVVNDFKDQGVIFVDEINLVPKGERIILSAHGVPPSVIEEALARDLKVIDATCPLVARVHAQAVKYSKENINTILIGHKGHQEIIGTAGYVKEELLHIVENKDDVDCLSVDENLEVAFITQTTLSVDDTKAMIDKLKKKYSKLIIPSRSDLCYATQSRQDAVKELAKICDVIIICGSKNSSNSNRLCETGIRAGVASSLVDSKDELDVSILEGKNKVGVSSGASVPRDIVDGLVERISQKYSGSVVYASENPENNIVFKLPKI